MDATNFKETKYNKPFILCRADPYVTRDDNGNYFFTASVPEYDRIVLRKSITLDGLACAQERTVWTKHDDGIMSAHIWAPELHFVNGRWYIYYAGGDKDDIWAIRPYVLLCNGLDPMNDEWIEMGKMNTEDNFSFTDFSLDMTVFEHCGKWYCVWAEKVSVGKKISNLYIAEMKNATTLSSAQVLLSYPAYDWERIGFWVNEGPAFIRHENKVYLTYSASATGKNYCMGMLSADQGSDLLDPYVWKKKNVPILRTDYKKGLFGPGHNSFVKTDDGMHDVMFYHARQYDFITGDPLYDPNRHTYRMKVEWNIFEEPVFDFVNNF